MRLSLQRIISFIVITCLCCIQVSFASETKEVLSGINPIQLGWSESIRGETSGSRNILIGDRAVEIISLYKLPDLNRDQPIQLVIESSLVYNTKNESKTIFYPSLLLLNGKYEITNDYPALSYQHNKGFFSQGSMKADLILKNQHDKHTYLAVYSNPEKIGQEYSYCVTDYGFILLDSLVGNFTTDDICSTVNFSNVGEFYLSINKYKKPEKDEMFSKVVKPLKDSDIADVSRYCYERHESPVECMKTYGYLWDGHEWSK